MSEKRPKRQRRKDDFALQVRKVDGWVSVANTAIRWGFGLGIAVQAVKGLEVLAGRTTLANIGITVGWDLLGQLPVSHFLWGAFGIGGILFGVLQNQMRASTIEKLHKQIQEYELLLDPGRSTSALTPRGQTPKEERL